MAHHSLHGLVHEVSQVVAHASKVALGPLEHFAKLNKSLAEIVVLAEHRDEGIEFHELVLVGVASYVLGVVVQEVQHNMLFVGFRRQAGPSGVDFRGRSRCLVSDGGSMREVLSVICHLHLTESDSRSNLCFASRSPWWVLSTRS